MWTKLAICVPTVVVSLALTFAPVFAQDTQETYDGAPTTAVESDDDDGPDLGWLGLRLGRSWRLDATRPWQTHGRR